MLFRYRTNSKRFTHIQVIVKNLESSKEKSFIKYKGLTANFSSKTTEARREWGDICKEMTETKTLNFPLSIK